MEPFFEKGKFFTMPNKFTPNPKQPQSLDPKFLLEKNCSLYLFSTPPLRALQSCPPARLRRCRALPRALGRYVGVSPRSSVRRSFWGGSIHCPPSLLPLVYLFAHPVCPPGALFLYSFRRSPPRRCPRLY